MKVLAIIVLLSLAIVLSLLIALEHLPRSPPKPEPQPEYNFELFDQAIKDRTSQYLNETGFAFPIVPNIVHFILFDKWEMTFTMYVSLLAALQNQKPDKLMIHCNCLRPYGKYWDLLKEHKNFSLVEVRWTWKPLFVFGQFIGHVYHAADVARIKILMKHGGIYLDTDSYIVQSLDHFRKFEMTIAWDEGQFLGNEIIVAHKDARFLRLWLDSYRGAYDSRRWYFNAGERPTVTILYNRPELVHRVKDKFGVATSELYNLYVYNLPEWEWTSRYYTIHAFANHRYAINDTEPETFDMENIKMYSRTYGAMSRKVLFGSSDLIFN